MKKMTTNDWVEYYLKNPKALEAFIDDANRINKKLYSDNLDFVAALEEIAKGEGAYSRDQLTHANNTIENMLSIAEKAIKKAKGE